MPSLAATLDGTLWAAYCVVFYPERVHGRRVPAHWDYKSRLATFDRCLGRPALVDDLNDDALRSAIVQLERKGKSAASRRGFRGHLLSLWRYLYQRGIVPRWPDVPPVDDPAEAARVIVRRARRLGVPVTRLNPGDMESLPVLTRDELARLWAAASRFRGANCGALRGPRARFFWQALLSMMWETRQLPGKILQWAWESFDWSKIRPDTARLLRRCRRPGQSSLLVWPLQEKALWPKFAALARHAGIETRRVRSFRCLVRSALRFGDEFHPADLIHQESGVRT
jgi:hypothetical protein